MSRREISQVDYSAVPPSKCAKVFYYTWKICSVVFSHFVMISLVIAYCILGAFTFEKLEADNEKDVKRSISKIRGNVTQNIWQLTTDMAVLHPDNWTHNVVHQLKKFEGEILTSMKQRGWDGEESTDHIQWTFTGALFYSIIVITTIGYGHIAPKTQAGKVVTIFYAILGIPLMLLCLSNIGDVMASSFRFLYWRVCCYVCTRPPKPRRRNTHRRSMRASTRRRHPHSDTENRFRDSGHNSSRKRRPRPHSQPPLQTEKRSHYRDEPLEKFTYKNKRVDPELEEFPKVSLPLDDLEAALYELEQHQRRCQSEDFRSKSLPRPSSHKKYNRHQFRQSEDFIDDSYDDGFIHADPRFDMRDDGEAEFDRRQMSQRYNTYGGRRFVDRADRDYEPDDEDFELYPNTKNRNINKRKFTRGFSEYHHRDARDIYNDNEGRHKRAHSAIYNYEGHRMGTRCQDDERYVGDNRNWAGNNRKKLRRLDTRDEISKRSNRYSPSSDREEENWSDLEANYNHKRYRNKLQGSSFRQSEMQLSVESTAKTQIKPVPIWLCVMLVASYIVAGSFLFQHWENWQFLDATYFCFVTLTTIGFGDFVPAQGGRADKTDAVKSIALCSLYLLFGISLLAMSFNLVQEEVIANVKAVAKKLGIIKSEGDSDEETE